MEVREDRPAWRGCRNPADKGAISCKAVYGRCPCGWVVWRNQQPVGAWLVVRLVACAVLLTGCGASLDNEFALMPKVFDVARRSCGVRYGAVLEAVAGIGNGHGTRLAIAAAIFLIMLIGGRIIPSFTRNWLARCGPGRLPAPFNRFDVGAMAISGMSLASWVMLPASVITAASAIAACAFNVGRLCRWAGERTTAQPLVSILHVAYAFVPVGFGLLSLGILAPGIVAPTGALHGWTTGAIGLMTLAVMTRASLGHSGRPLMATRSIQLIYLAALVAAVVRIAVAFGLMREPMLHLSATAWVAAFGGFVVIYAPLLCTTRRA